MRHFTVPLSPRLRKLGYEMWLLIASLFAVHVLTARANSTVATSFLMAFPCYSADSENPVELFLYVTNANDQKADLSFESPIQSFAPDNQSVDANSTLQIPVYSRYLVVCDDENFVTQKGLLIQSSQPVSVYVDMEASDGSSAKTFLVLPTNMLGIQYALNYELYNTVVALEDNTQVTYGFGSITETIVLNRLEAVNILRASQNGTDSEFPGSITSNKSIAVIYLTTPYPSESTGSDAYMALQVDFKAYEFPIIPNPVTDSKVRVFGLENNTIVIVNGDQTAAPIDAGNYLDVYISGPSVIVTSKKAQVVTGDNNEPMQFAAQVVPPDYFLTSRSYLFHPMTNIQYNSGDPTHSLVIITTLASTGQIALDGTTIPVLQYKRIPSSSYYYVTVPVSSDQHLITTNSSSVKYTASVYSTYSGGPYANAKFNIGLDLK